MRGRLSGTQVVQTKGNYNGVVFFILWNHVGINWRKSMFTSSLGYTNSVLYNRPLFPQTKNNKFIILKFNVWGWWENCLQLSWPETIFKKIGWFEILFLEKQTEICQKRQSHFSYFHVTLVTRDKIKEKLEIVGINQVWNVQH